MADRSVKVTLSAQVQGYIAGMEQAAKATRETGSEAEKLAQKQQAFEQMGRAAMVAGGAMAAGLLLSTKAAIDWDSAWAGVTKTVDGSPEQLAAVESGLRGLAKVLPASHTEIAAVAEAAGQLGIETPNVVAFTKTMIDLGETTNLSAEQAAMSLARFVNIMGTSQSDVDRLGSALVGLGNNFATTESEILAMSMRLAKSGVQIGLSEGEVLGLATALSSVGIEAEAGGSAMSKVMIDIAASVETGSDKLGLFAKTAGMSAEDFSAKWKSAPAEALAAFVKGLSNAESQGSSTLGVLAELGITEVRMRDALLGSAAAADQFAGAMEMGNDAFSENTALVEEAEKRYETTAAKLGMMRNRVVDAAISVGEHFLPAVEAVAEGVGNFAEMLSGLDGPMGAVVAWGGLLTAGILLTGGAALIAIPKIAAYKVALEVLGVPTAAIRGKLGNLAGFLTGPWGLALLAAATGLRILGNAMDEAKATSMELEIGLKQGKTGIEVMREEAEKGLNVKGFYDVAGSIENLGAVLESSAGHANSFTKAMFQDFDDKAAIENLREYGRVLAQLSASDLPGAIAEFKSFGDSADLTTDQLALAINEMPEFKSALLDAADAAGVATDDASLLQFALGEIGPAAADAADGADAGAESLDGLGNTAEETQEAIEKLADEIRGFNAPVFDMRDANRRLEDSFKSLGESLANHGNNFDIATSAGRDNEAALDDVASATNRAAAAVFEATGDQEAMNAKLAEGRNALVDILAPYFESRDAAAAYVSQLDLISPEKVTEIIAQTADAQAGIDAVSENNPPDKLFQISADALDAYKGIDGVNTKKIDAKTAYVWGDTKDATSKIEDINKKQTPRKIVEITADSSGFESAWANISGRVGSALVNIFKSDKNADGGMYAYANGGIAAYADGGFATGIYKGGAPIHKFAEPETGWEAYISGKPDQRDRNRQIWAETGRRLGIDSEQTGTTVQVIVNAAPGMDENGLVRRVIKEVERRL